MPRLHLLPILLALLLPFSGATAQGPHPVGFRDVALPNPGMKGTPLLAARICHPAAHGGLNVPFSERSPAYPVVVFLHGFSALGRSYQVLGYLLAQAGYVAVLVDTAQFCQATLAADGEAIHHALSRANRDRSSSLHRRLDMGRTALLGHSMGGGSALMVASRCRLYRSILVLAPQYPPATNLQEIALPIGMVHGLGDQVVAWKQNALRVYQECTGYDRFKFLYLLGDTCHHYNLTGAMLWHESDVWVWYRLTLVITGFFQATLRDDPSGLEEILGEGGRQEPSRHTTLCHTRRPLLWAPPSIRLGASGKLSLYASPGPILLCTAWGTTELDTPLGSLRLDPVTLIMLAQEFAGPERLVDLRFTVPISSPFAGVSIPFQAIGFEGLNQARLSNFLALKLVR